MNFIYPYYENTRGLEMQAEEWSKPHWKNQHIIVVDDGSPTQPALPILKNLTNVSLYRVLVNIPFNQHGARNLGAEVADDGWLFMSDIDHIVRHKALEGLLDIETAPHTVYEVSRELPDGQWYGSHPNTFLVTRELFWKAGGYDEDYSGSYGGDSQFKSALYEAALGKAYFKDIVLEYHKDMRTEEWDRWLYRSKYRSRYLKKQKTGNTTPVNPIRFPWERQL